MTLNEFKVWEVNIVNNELYHWKYIKREKKNGKWVYTYDNPKRGHDLAGKAFTSRPNRESIAKGSTLVEIGRRNARQTELNEAAGAGAPEVRRNTDKLFSTIQTIKLGNETIGKYHNVGKLERAIYDRKKDWAESKKRATDKAIEEATKYDGGVVIGGNGSKNIRKTFTDTDDLLSGTTTIETLDTQITQTRRGKIERYVDTAKEYVKDRLGFDEKEVYDKAKINERTASLQKSAATVNAKDAYNRLNDSNSSIFEKAIAKKDYKEATDDYLDKDVKYRRAKIKSDKAKDKFYDTPIGKVAEAKERIDSAKDYIEELFKPKKRKKK